MSNVGPSPVNPSLPLALQGTGAASPTTSPSGAPILPPPASADVGEAIATLVIESALANRKTARDTKHAAASALEHAEDAEIANMRQAADSRYNAAKADAFAQMASGGLTAGSAYVGNTAAMTFKGGAEVAKGGFSFFYSAGEKRDADRADIAAKQAAHAATHAKTTMDDAIDDEKAAKDSVRKALEFLKDYSSSQQQAQAAATHRA